MQDHHVTTLSRELSLPEAAVAGAVALFDDGAGLPFIARYRKERTGGMDEEILTRLRDRLAELRELDGRRQAILDSLRERELLTPELEGRITAAATRSALEDIYLPYRPRRKTRASVARERGLEPLARRLLGREPVDPRSAAGEFVEAAGAVPDVEGALAGARDILAEWISEDAALRGELRELFARRALLSSRRRRGAAGSADPAEVYRDYFDWSEAAAKAPSHRVLAMFRGEREGLLSVHVLPPEERALELVERRYLPSGAADPRSPAQRGQLQEACGDAYKRLLAPSLETEAKGRLKAEADETAAAVFARNLRELLLAAPLGERPVLAVDPGFRSGCKVVCLSSRGELLHHEAIYPLEPRNRREESARRVRELLTEHGIQVVAVGNGTGSREALSFLRNAVAAAGTATGPAAGADRATVPVLTVSEAGASVYSASKVARQEFPHQDVTVRGAVSIGRRLMDPLAELVKIDPRSIGVGQYQHDVDQKLLDARLTDTVVSCVNAVGVELNTASPHLLRYVSGISPRLAGAIVAYRREQGGFRSRGELRKVSGLGAKTFEEAAGFLRVRGGEHALDATGIHPERYGLVETMARDLGVAVEELVGNHALCEGIDLDQYLDERTGRETLQDIREELLRPGRDPRPAFEAFAFSEEVHDISDLREGMKLPGVVTNVTNFGAFVDIGVHRDGLIHISKLADRYVSDPREVVHVNQTLTVTVIEVDIERMRIGLSLLD